MYRISIILLSVLVNVLVGVTGVLLGCYWDAIGVLLGYYWGARVLYYN